jgi:transposase
MVRLLWVGKERTVKTFHSFFDMLGKETCAGIEFVCSDMWRPYLRVIRERCRQALHILDRFHIVSKMNQALDDVRASEARRLAAAGRRPLLKHSRWCLILNWFRAKGEISNGVVEGLNNKAKLTMRKSYGFRSPEILEIALLHALGKLPEPKLAHEFW